MTHSFPAQIHRNSDTCSVCFPDLRGCYTFGETIEEALTNAAEVLSLHLEGFLEDGLKIPQRSDTIMLIRPGNMYTLIAFEVDDGMAQRAR